MKEVKFELNSRIKMVFSDEMLKLFAAICDTTRVVSYQKKMILVQQILVKYEVPFCPLGGATNRFVVQIDNLCYKFALDAQGYQDNMVEYSLSTELYPYVAKSYETNGYILVAELVKTMELSDWNSHHYDITKILGSLSEDYLLGDVGYISKNYTNWGIRGENEPVILDYAYIHRATQDLFICPVCGSGILRYDYSYSLLTCNNHINCGASFSYTEIKERQGDSVDNEIIEDAIHTSLLVPKGKVSVIGYINHEGDLSQEKPAIHTWDAYCDYLEKARQVAKFYPEIVDKGAIDTIMHDLALAESDEEVTALLTELEKAYEVAWVYPENWNKPNIDMEAVYRDRENILKEIRLQKEKEEAKEAEKIEEPFFEEPFSKTAYFDEDLENSEPEEIVSDETEFIETEDSADTDIKDSEIFEASNEVNEEEKSVNLNEHLENSSDNPQIEVIEENKEPVLTINGKSVDEYFS